MVTSNQVGYRTMIAECVNLGQQRTMRANIATDPAGRFVLILIGVHRRLDGL